MMVMGYVTNGIGYTWTNERDDVRWREPTWWKLQVWFVSQNIQIICQEAWNIWVAIEQKKNKKVTTW